MKRPKHPIPVRHWTVQTVSDHRAYLVTYLLPSGHFLTIGTFNLSIHAAKHQPDRLLQDLIQVAIRCDVLLMQEAGAARSIVTTAARGAHRDVYFGTGQPGQASTPIMVRRGITHHFRSEQLHPRRWMGQGAGPKWAKPKFVMIACLLIEGQAHNVGNIHATPSTRFPVRALLARLQFRRAAKFLLALDGWAYLGGDLNQNALLSRLPLLAPWRRRGLRSSQRRLGSVPTHGRRALDDVYAEIRRRHAGN